MKLDSIRSQRLPEKLAMTTIPALIFLAAYFLLIAEALFPKRETNKTSQQELGEAIAKYLSENNSEKKVK